MALPTTLGTESIGRLLRQYAVPAIVAMTASSLYNMIDSIFIGQGVGPLAISGLAVTFPFMNLAAAFGSLVGVGASTMVSVKLGQKDYTTARKVLGNVVALNTIIGVAFMTISLIFLDKILLFFGASENTLSYARDYMEIILYGNVVTHMYLGLNAVMRSSGHPQKAMAMTIMTVVLNAILDPIFIFGFGWGIRGAAIATILAQVVALAWLLIAFTNKKDILHFESGIFKLDKRIVTSSLSIGMAPFLMNIASCVIVIFINNGLQQHGGDLAIGAYGIVNRITFIFVMVVMGLNQGMQPIAGYNYGARNIDRMLSVLKLTIVWATVIMCFGFVICEFMPGLIARIFTSDEELIERSVRGMRIVAIFFPIIGMQMVTGNFFQSIGMARQAIFLSLTRQLIFLLPCLIVLPMFWGAIMRSAECAGAHGVIIPKRRSVGLTATVAKASAGAVEYMKVARVTNINNAISELKEKGVWVFGTAAEGSIPMYKADLTGPAAIVIGNEGDGMSQLVRKNCDVMVHIPMKGSISSLNASAAASILLYEAVRQRLA